MSHPVSRRLFFCTAAMLACGSLSLATPAVAADAWPNQPIKLLVGFAPGGANDIVARIIAKELQQSLGETVVVDNKPGAGGLIASEAVAKAQKAAGMAERTDTRLEGDRQSLIEQLRAEREQHARDAETALHEAEHGKPDEIVPGIADPFRRA